MGVWGAIIMGFFGAVFAAATLALALQWTGAAIGLPFVGFAVIVLAAIVVIRQPGSGFALSRQGKRAILWSSTAEGIGIFLAVNIVNNLGHPDWLLPAVALVVGLHFFPIAYAVPFRFFYLLGMALLAAAASGFVIGTAVGAEVAGFAAATALWLAAVLAIARDSRAKTISA